MQRKIKFRKWCPITKRFRHSEYTGYWNVGIDDEHFLCRVNDDEISQIDDEEYPIQQFTGLSDKNGKEIYEGDLCIYVPNFEPAPVVFSNTLAGFVFDSSRRHNIDKKYGDYVPMHREYCNYYEVVGNIFENPELV